jgi:hypothetical protein
VVELLAFYAFILAGCWAYWYVALRIRTPRPPVIRYRRRP